MERRDLYEMLTERHRAGSIIVTSNRGADAWLATVPIPSAHRRPSMASRATPMPSSSDADSYPVCQRPGDDRTPITVIQGVARSLPGIRSSFLGHPRRSIRTRAPVERRKPTRLWKCRRYGNHRTVSTAPWKSRTEREIPTFPQPLPVGHDEDDEENTTNGRRLHNDGWTTDARLAQG